MTIKEELIQRLVITGLSKRQALRVMALFIHRQQQAGLLNLTQPLEIPSHEVSPPRRECWWKGLKEQAYRYAEQRKFGTPSFLAKFSTYPELNAQTWRRFA